MHLTFGGSTMARTFQCPGWIKASEGIPNRSSSYAQKGTALHACMEDILLHDRDPEEFRGITVEGEKITDDDVNDKLIPATQAFNDLCDAYSVDIYEAETFVKIAEDSGGTADFICRGEDVVIIGDFKFGYHPVDPTNNTQGMFYALCANETDELNDLFEDRDEIVIAIIQPHDEFPVLRTWQFPASDLIMFRKQFLQARREAKSENPRMAAGPACKFCPAASVCPERTGEAISALRMDPEDLSTLSESLALVKDLREWIASVEQVAHEQLNAGAEVKGWKLVQKRALARWEDEDLVIKTFRRKLGGLSRITSRKLLSPAQMKKLAKTLGKEIDFDEFIVKTSSGTAIAPEDDKRPAVPAAEAIAQALKSLNSK
jgi:hypothetical protein